MPDFYNPSIAEPKWQKAWEDAKVYETDLKNAKNPFYSLVMFPYPSGDKLHVGHWYNYAPADSEARFKKMQGHDVFSPMGFDAFGLPAENYAIKTGVHPAESTKKNVQTMITQLKKIGCMYDWSKMVNTTDPSYYRWTQWLFLEMYKHGLAYKKLGNVNWCPKDQTVLANEQVWEGKCERCGSDVIQKPLEQWFWNIKKYSQALLDGLETLDWPKKTKVMQQNWIGRSEGAEVKFDVDGVQRGVVGPMNWPMKSDTLTGDLNRRLTDGWKGRIHSPRTCHIVFPPYKRAHAFYDPAEAHRILSILDRICDRHDIVLHEAAAMPDHIHLLISFESNRHLEMDIIKKLKGASAREFLKEYDAGDRHLWAEGKHFEDVLNEQQFQKTIAYIQNNPREADVDDNGRILSRLPLEISVFTTRPDTLFGATYIVLAPEHRLVDHITTDEFRNDVEAYKAVTVKKTEMQRTELKKGKTGEFTGAYCINPANSARVPIWIADYALMNYGTGAVMGVPGHDERDFDFATPRQSAEVKIACVIEPVGPMNWPVKTGDLNRRFTDAGDRRFTDAADRRFTGHQADHQLILEGKKCWTGSGKIINSGFLNGFTVDEAKKKMIEWLEKNKKGKKFINYRLRDWLVSRQRYWGAPIPIVYDPDGKPHPVPEEHLPWLLPTDVEFKPTGTSPLAESKEFVARTEKIFGKGWRPEVDTMDTFVCSSFYYLRYLADPHPPAPSSEGGRGGIYQQKNSPLPSGEGLGVRVVDPVLEKRWLPVSMYIGGPEHACMHLIYARFVMMALKDFGHVSHSEPFKKLVHQGLITNKGAKMSKSKGNVVSPDSFVEKYGSDVFRMYLMFMGPFEGGGDWSDTGIKGIVRFVDRLWNALSNKKLDQDSESVKAALHRTIKKVGEDIQILHFNTAISALMELLNTIESGKGCSKESAKTIALLLGPLAPHLAEELWSVLGGKGFLIEQSWPAFDPALLVESTMTIVVQVNGKVRGDLKISKDASKEEIFSLAKKNENVQKYIAGGIKKEIYVAGKLVSLVV